MLAAYSRASFPLFSLNLISSEEETILVISVTISCRVNGSCLTAVVTSASAIAPPSKPHYLEKVTASLHLRWRPSSSLAVTRKAAIKPEDSVACLSSEAGSSIGYFLLSPIAGLSLDLNCPTTTCYCGRAGRVEGASLDSLA